MDNKLFYEDFEDFKKRLRSYAILSLICSFMIGFGSVIDMLNGNMTISIILVVISLFALIQAVGLFVYRSKSKALKQVITVSEEEFTFKVSVHDKTNYSTYKLKDVKAVPEFMNTGKAKLFFKDDIQITLNTRKFKELKLVLEGLLKRNKEKG